MREFPISFKLPDGDYGSRFMDAPARYWELEVKAAPPGWTSARSSCCPSMPARVSRVGYLYFDVMTRLGEVASIEEAQTARALVAKQTRA